MRKKIIIKHSIHSLSSKDFLYKIFSLDNLVHSNFPLLLSLSLPQVPLEKSRGVGHLNIKNSCSTILKNKMKVFKTRDLES